MRFGCRSLFILPLIAAWLLGVSTQQAAAANLFGVAFDTDDSPFVKIDSATGNAESVGSTGAPWLNSLGRRSTGAFITASNPALFSSDSPTLFSLNPSTGASSALAALDFDTETASIRALAFSSSGTLFAIHNGAGGADSLYTVDTATGVGTLVGDTGRFGVQALAFSPDGDLYGWDVGTTNSNKSWLVKLNTASGVVDNELAASGPGVDGVIQTIVFDADGNLYGAHFGLYSIDPSTAATAQIGSGWQYDVRGIEFPASHLSNSPSVARSAAPEPSSLWLLMSGMFGLLAFPLRRSSHE